ncbi:MAG TPA: LuxR C-terminal-related transcriptional regulator [Candidatus Rubrimentiphilum sp.]|nr:LuxR C-terminal-related transcriptional regulator [Candidatus Rubrimentiphilum sp.]
MQFTVQVDHCTLLGFARGLSEAFSSGLPELISTVSSAHQSSASSPEPGKEMAVWMATHLKGFNGVIAIDDFHRCSDDLEVSRFVAHMISQTKSCARWIIATRSSLDLPVATWLAYGDVDSIVDESDLAFRDDEVCELASRAGVSEKRLESIMRATAGWPVALGFALRSSQLIPDSASIATATREMLFQYLAEQVYDDLTVSERAILHLASYLPAIDTSVLEAAGCENCEPILETVRKRATFLALERPGLYSFHELFRDFLCRQLEVTDPRRARELQLEAAKALERIGNVVAALRLYAAAHSGEDVLRLLRSRGFDLVDHSHSDTVEAAIRRLPENVRRSDATVLGLRAQREADAGRFDRAQVLFEKAVHNAPEPLSAATFSIRLAISVLNQGRPLAEILEPFMHTQCTSVRAEILGLLSADYALRGHPDEAAVAINEAELLSRNLEDDAITAKIALRIAVAGMNIGLPISRVRNSALTAAELAESAGLIVVAGRAFAVLATACLFLENDLTEYIHYGRKALDCAMQSGDRFSLETALFMLACAETQAGGEAELRELIDRLAEIRHPTSGRDRVLHLLRATLFAWGGDMENADRLMDLFGSGGYSYYDFDQAADRAVHAMYSLAAGSPSKARSISTEGARRLKAVRPAHAYAKSQAEIADVLFALVHVLSERKSSGRRALTRVLARPCHIATGILGKTVQSIAQVDDVSAWEQVAALGLRELEEHGLSGLAKSVRWCIKLTAARILERSPAGCALTASELAVMRALDLGQSTKEVAAATGRSFYTVRTLVQRATAKLGCSGRQQALALLRRRGFLSESDA